MNKLQELIENMDEVSKSPKLTVSDALGLLDVYKSKYDRIADKLNKKKNTDAIDDKTFNFIASQNLSFAKFGV